MKRVPSATLLDMDNPGGIAKNKCRQYRKVGKLKVGKLIVVAGPTCAGKSTFIGKVQENVLPWLSHQLQLGDSLSWKTLSANSAVRSSKQTSINRLILHYDFLRSWALDGKSWENDEALELLKTANEITVVTIWATPEKLLERIDAEIAAKERAYQNWEIHRLAGGVVSTALSKGPRKSVKKLFAGKYSRGYLDTWLKKHRKVRRLYEDPAMVMHFYRRWFAFCERYGWKAHWILNGAGEEKRLCPLSEWTRKSQDRGHIAPALTRHPRRDTSN